MFGHPKKSLLHCPACGHQQEEAHTAFSTYCRGCWTYYKIAGGAAVPIPPAPSYPFRTRDAHAPVGRNGSGSASGSHPAQPSPPPAPRVARRPAQLELFPVAAMRASVFTAVPASPRHPLVATSSGDHPALARMARQLPETPPKGFRHVHCLACDFPQSIPLAALSTMCLRCSEAIPLEDYDLRTMHHRRIRTRGNVHIRRKGGLNGVSIHCNDLTIEGEFTGSGIDCDGDLRILRNGTITGPVRCRRLVVEGRAELAFTHPVHAQEVLIDGIVHGTMICERKLHLAEHAILNGDIQTRSLSVSEGARHNGKVSMPQPAKRYAKFGTLSEIEGMGSPRQAPPQPATLPAAGPTAAV